MADFLDVIESIRAEDASSTRLLGGEGTPVRRTALHKNPKYPMMLAEAAKLVADVVKGRRPARVLQEAMTTSDFPYLFGDILDRQLLAAYQEAPAAWSNFAKRGSVRDFRTVKRYGVYGADQVLSSVAEKGEYPYGKINENIPFSYAVKKYGRKIPFSFESIVNDDLDALTDAPVRLGRAARRSEQKFVTELYVGASGPHASFYTVGNKNIVTSNPRLSITGLQTAMAILASVVDEQGEPIYIDAVELVVPPALEVTAMNILDAVQIEIDPNPSAGTETQRITTINWMRNRVRLTVDPYIPVVASSANGSTSWFLFANPSNGRPALELGFLRGYEEPQVFMKASNATQIGGGGDDFDFDTDSREYKVRHIFGGTQMDPKMTVASNGSGS